MTPPDPIHIAETDAHDDQCEAFFVEGPNVMHPCGCEERRSAETVRVEWAELWPDGTVSHVHVNRTPIGRPTNPPPHAHRGTVWAKRTVTYGPWGQSDGTSDV